MRITGTFSTNTIWRIVYVKLNWKTCLFLWFLANLRPNGLSGQKRGHFGDFFVAEFFEEILDQLFFDLGAAVMFHRRAGYLPSGDHAMAAGGAFLSDKLSQETSCLALGVGGADRDNNFVLIASQAHRPIDPLTAEHEISDKSHKIGVFNLT